MKQNWRNLWLILFIAVLAAALFGYEFFSPPKMYGEVIEPPTPMPDITLQSASGPVSLSDYKGKWIALYFGYTSCPDLCPTTLAVLKQGIERLGEQAGEVQVIFVSVDWRRDTPELLEKYTAHFNPSFLGLTGSQEQIDSAAKDYGIYFLLNPPDQNGFYTVDHTASVKLLDQERRLVVIWPYGVSAENITSDLQTIMKRSQ